MAQLNMYLTFEGNTKAAFDFYKTVFGGEFREVMRYSDMPPTEGGPQLPEAALDKIMHMALPITDTCVLMGSDSLEAVSGDASAKVIQGNNYTIVIEPDSEADARSIFEKLAAGGSVQMPLAQQFWGSLFGKLVDKYGVIWAVDYVLEGNAAQG